MRSGLSSLSSIASFVLGLRPLCFFFSTLSLVCLTRLVRLFAVLLWDFLLSFRLEDAEDET